VRQAQLFLRYYILLPQKEGQLFSCLGVFILLSVALQPFLDVYVHSPTTYYVYVATKPRTSAGRQAPNVVSAATSSEGSH
jgi:hypothetical protein